MDGRTLARFGAIIFVAIAITAAVVEVRIDRRPSPPPIRPKREVSDDATDPRRDELIRCQQLGEAATQDRTCLNVWAESRRRFLGMDPERP